MATASWQDQDDFGPSCENKWAAAGSVGTNQGHLHPICTRDKLVLGKGPRKLTAIVPSVVHRQLQIMYQAWHVVTYKMTCALPFICVLQMPRYMVSFLESMLCCIKCMFVCTSKT